MYKDFKWGDIICASDTSDMKKDDESRIDVGIFLRRSEAENGGFTFLDLDTGGEKTRRYIQKIELSPAYQKKIIALDSEENKGSVSNDVHRC